MIAEVLGGVTYTKRTTEEIEAGISFEAGNGRVQLGGADESMSPGCRASLSPRIIPE